jgi:hypothetical protein
MERSGSAAPYATPVDVRDISDCLFYHSMEIPGYGEVEGEWDLRGGVVQTLGGVNLSGKRVLELGTASGFLCFSMEKMGAEVVAHDLSDQNDWDIVPYAGIDFEASKQSRKEMIRRLNNGFWLAHRAFGSKARVVHGSIYELPESIGPVDVATFTSILLHLRDPFRALERALRLTRETVIITESFPRRPFVSRLAGRLSRPSVQFLPNFRKQRPTDTWWRFSPEVLIAFIGVLGFTKVELTRHSQMFKGRSRRRYTIVGHRGR